MGTPRQANREHRSRDRNGREGRRARRCRRGALNYERLAERVLEFVGASEFKLVETLAEAIAKIVVAEFGAPWAKVSVAKPGAIPRARDVGIVIERSAADFG